MNQLRMVKDEIGNVYLSQEDLMTVLSERLARFPDELERLSKPSVSTLVGADGRPVTKPSDPIEVAKHMGKQEMLEGVISIINVVDEE